MLFWAEFDNSENCAKGSGGLGAQIQRPSDAGQGLTGRRGASGKALPVIPCPEVYGSGRDLSDELPVAQALCLHQLQLP